VHQIPRRAEVIGQWIDRQVQWYAVILIPEIVRDPVRFDTLTFWVRADIEIDADSAEDDLVPQPVCRARVRTGSSYPSSPFVSCRTAPSIRLLGIGRPSAGFGVCCLCAFHKGGERQTVADAQGNLG